MRSVAVLAAVFWLATVSAFSCAAFAPRSAPAQTQSPQSSTTGATVPNTPTDPDPALTRARSLLEKGHATEAETATRAFLKSHPDSAEGHFLLGYILFDELHEKYSVEEQREGEAFRFGNVSSELAKLRDAKARESLAELSEGAKYGMPSAFDLKIMALDYVLLRDNLTAAKWMTVSLNLNPKDAQGWFYLGRMKYSQDQFASAIEAFEACLRLEPKNFEAEYHVGLSYEGLKQTDDAIQAYQTAITWEGEGMKAPEPYLSLGRLYLNQDQPDKAVPYLEQAVAKFPKIPLGHEQLGKAYSRLHELPKAQQELEKAVALAPNVASAHFELGQVYRQLGMMDKAKIEFHTTEELNGAHSSGKSGN
jgi:Flp pilus assembly protein TadD